MSAPQLEFSPLLDWVEGRLPPQAAQEIELLLADASPEVRATVQWLNAFTRARRAVVLADPPAAIREQLRVQFAAYAAARKSPGLFQRMAAALTFDSLLQPATAGARTAGGTLTQPRQLIFACSVADIALNVHRRPHDDQIDLFGQVFPHGQITPGGWGVLLIGAHGPDTTHTDDLGEFGFEGVNPGEYAISVETPSLSITMPMVALER